MRPVMLGLGLGLAALAVGRGEAWGASASGHDAVALGAVVGGHSPLLTLHQKANLAKILDDKAGTVSSPHKILVNAKSIDCGAGDVDIAHFACTLTFAANTSTLAGRRAQELYATLIEAGALEDGAAGTIHRAVYKLRCTLDRPVIAQNAGGGADCQFDTTGP